MGDAAESEEHPSKWDSDRLRRGLDPLLASGKASVSELHLLAERAAFEASALAAKGARAESLEWGAIAIRVYEHLDARESRGGRFLESAMRLRALLIARFGDEPGDGLRDAQRVKAWFMDGLSMDLEAVNKLLADRKSLPVETLRALRALKNRLRVIRPAASAPSLASNPDLNAWLDLEKRLP